MKKKRYIFFSVISMVSVLLMMLSVSSCSREGTDNISGTVTFTDALGREVSAPERPSRVAALIGSFAEIWQLSGGEVCAAAEDAWDDFGLSLGDAVNLGGAHSPSLELLLSSSPELVLASASTASNVELCDVLESVGITVAYFDVDNFDDYLKMLKICTEINCRDDLYEQNGLALLARIAEIKDKYLSEDVAPEERRVLLLRASSGFVKAKGSRGTVLGEMLFDIGCINIADGDGSLLDQLSIESVMASEPYHIFVVTMGEYGAAKSSLEKMINEDPAWSTLSAIREGRLHIMDKRLFNLKPNARYAEAYEVLYETLTK